ncbi:MAG: hypothetical protein A2087_04250 [Spirochaetes bacterium GWD1_61_31]|nr:MAG: hypothetical protein A2Y37_10815 [Spirochaetes bacterium GWB1_60_80]OHD29414.1 MAG: hypothetical protein A2004_03810 [Spirochaetes bacterium GWC1_61_12]OHD35421.1 MAG: hypothetical protein A2087_04250 [Spirochaetes bacterium GWD1_61_31]OHD44930.1 MAG: hypothetical protein A2Y35_12855 [Spirochaetes bacterium GWE1_60_18]OHD60040.1 MAG: hypothetical protein A2Y32_10970 [Spirochaetes bacterium GWF1_60_12]HAP43600.1 hypothetical protein [Spirochaetaceae bacterium]
MAKPLAKPEADDEVLPPIAPYPSSDDELENDDHRKRGGTKPDSDPAATAAVATAAAAVSDAAGEILENEAGIKSLNVSDSMRAKIRTLEKLGTRTQFRHRIALIGAAELDEKRPRPQQSGAMFLLEAFYEHGAPHWLDPVTAIMPLRDILFKMEAPPVADRGVFYVLTRAARGGISPAAFATHVVLPRMSIDYDWRRWKARHSWILDSIVDLLVSLRKQAPWNADRLGATDIISDIALCKYVGRPLARLVGERFTGQEAHLDSWRDAWKTFSFKSAGFLLFMRRAIMPCLYRMSGRIDPEQLAPIGRALSGLERTMGRRLNAMSKAAVQIFVDKAGLADNFDSRVQRRLDELQGSASLAVAREVKSFIELTRELAAFDAGPALLGRLSDISLKLDSAYLSDALTLTAALPKQEGTAILRWHYEALARVPAARRIAFITEVKSSGGSHSGCPYRKRRVPAPGQADATALALASGLSPEQVDALAQAGGGVLTLDRLRERLFTDQPNLAAAHGKLAAALATGLDRDWDMAQLEPMEALGGAGQELILRSLIPGLEGREGEPLSLDAIYNQYVDALKGPFIPASWALRLPQGPAGGGGIEPAGRDAARTRLDMKLLQQTWQAATAREPDAECAQAFADLGKIAMTLQRDLDREHSRALNEEAVARQKAGGSATGGSAALIPLPNDDPQVKALRLQVKLLDMLFAAMEDAPVNKLDARRFAAALLASSRFSQPGDEVCLTVLGGAVARYSRAEDHPSASCLAVRAIVQQLQADVVPAEVALCFLGIEQAAMLGDLVDALGVALTADDSLRLAIREIKAEAGQLLDFMEQASPLPNRQLTMESLVLALRRAAGAEPLGLELAKWRDLLIKLAPAETSQRPVRFLVSRSPLDALSGYMGGRPAEPLPAATLALIKRPGVLVGRLWDEAASRLAGSCLFAYVQAGATSTGIAKFWQFSALDPARVLMRDLGAKAQLAVYLGFRALAETLSKKTGLPVLIPGSPSSGMVSRDPAFAALIERYELAAGTLLAGEAQAGNTSASAIAEAYVIIDPRKPATYRADRELRRLGCFDGSALPSGPASPN